jgi:hypothetical protein
VIDPVVELRVTFGSERGDKVTVQRVWARRPLSLKAAGIPVWFVQTPGLPPNHHVSPRTGDPIGVPLNPPKRTSALSDGSNAKEAEKRLCGDDPDVRSVQLPAE